MIPTAPFVLDDRGRVRQVAIAEDTIITAPAADATVIETANLPDPHREPENVPGPAPSIGALRGQIGVRVKRTPLEWAWAAAVQLHTGARLPPAPRSGPALVTWAATSGRRRERTADLGEHLAPGDLVVFDRAVGGTAASLVAVVLGRDNRGVIEIIYLGGGVVRRGLVDPAHPRQRRDDDARTVNTYLRHNRDLPPHGTRFLTGELLALGIHLAD